MVLALSFLKAETSISHPMGKSLSVSPRASVPLYVCRPALCVGGADNGCVM